VIWPADGSDKGLKQVANLTGKKSCLSTEYLCAKLIDSIETPMGMYHVKK
jgi:hypothetical protein